MRTEMINQTTLGDRGQNWKSISVSSVKPPASCKVYTPSALAEAMVDALYSSSTQEWLEPSVGHGVFLEALRDRCVPPRQVVAVDLETERHDSDNLATVYRGVDFLEWASSCERRFDCVVGNPPFVPIRSLPALLRSSAAEVKDHHLRPIGVSANTWYAFALQSIALLRRGGCLALVLPSSCEYANYCQPGRDSITSRFDRIDLIRSRRPLFDDVQEGTAILVCSSKDGAAQTFRRHEVDDLDSVVTRLRDLAAYKAKRCPKGVGPLGASEEKFGNVVEIRLGGVTGDAQYFAINESRRKEMGIPLRAVRPVVTKARQVRTSELSTDVFQRLRDADERIWLFDPPVSLLDHEAVSSYLNLAIENGGCHRERYKIRNRDPWHKTPLPQRPHAFVSGMSTFGVWLCFNDCPRLSATNTLYVVRFRSADDRARRYEWALALLSSRVHRQLRRSLRVYADGLTKLEPGQLAQIRVPIPGSLPNVRRVYQTAVAHLLRGDGQTSRRLADEGLSASVG